MLTNNQKANLLDNLLYKTKANNITIKDLFILVVEATNKKNDAERNGNNDEAEKQQYIISILNDFIFIHLCSKYYYVLDTDTMQYITRQEAIKKNIITDDDGIIAADGDTIKNINNIDDFIAHSLRPDGKNYIIESVKE